MLRNSLITWLSERGNDPVTVDLGGILVDVDSVTYDRGSIVLILDPEDMRDTLKQVIAGVDDRHFGV